ncbi:MAG TPA: nucleoside hydrolase [Verrucomicrobiae bacterium]|nr:nucleoside hydrolase [Verrucomicrobiae bacterium]
MNWRTLIASLVALLLLAAPGFSQVKKIPVILDTDIGDDIDDTWALVMALKSPEIDLKMVVTDYGKSTYRARIVAKILEIAGRANIAVGLGINGADVRGRQSAWTEGYDLKKFPGKVHQDGIGAMIDMIMASAEPMTLLCIGPVPNIAEALKREPKIAQRARFVGMHGSVRVGYGESKNPSAEWNVKADSRACRAALGAPWDVTITPLDTCGLVRLEGDRYARVRDCRDPLVVALMENYRAWSAADKEHKTDPENASTTLFDTVAVYLVFSTDMCRMERLPIAVTEAGMTVIDGQAGKPISVATEWMDLKAFEGFLADRLTK